ncbi:hypothetical protein FQZ97_1058360 [compost metagenome]
MNIDLDPRVPLLSVEIDFVLEDELSRLIGYEPGSRALERKRQRGVIPKGVYAIIDGRITYSIKRYNAWIESQWPSLPESISKTGPSASASCGTAAGVPKSSPTRKRRKASSSPPVLELR